MKRIIASAREMRRIPGRTRLLVTETGVGRFLDVDLNSKSVRAIRRALERRETELVRQGRLKPDRRTR